VEHAFGSAGAAGVIESRPARECPGKLTIAVVASGSAGDFNPLLTLSSALTTRGHMVQTIVPTSAAGPAERLGLNPVVVPDTVNVPRGLPPRVPAVVSSSWAFQGLYRLVQRRRKTLLIMRWVYRRLAENQEKYAVVVSRVPDFGARLSRDGLGIPFVGLPGQPAAIHSVHEALGLPLPDGNNALLRAARGLMWRGIHAAGDRMFAGEINRFRRELGLPPILQSLNDWAFSPDLNIGLFPAWYGPPQPDWPANSRLTGFYLYDGGETGEFPADVQEFLRQGPPPVIITRGTRQERSESFFEAAVEACRRLGLRGMLVARAPDSVVRRLPTFARHFPYVPFGRLLPRAAAVIHHGGMGTTAQAIAAGTPQLVVPIADDHWDQGRRVEKLGVGAWLHPNRFRGRRAASKLASLLGSVKIRDTCRHYAEMTASVDPVVDTCRLIEKLVAHRLRSIIWLVTLAGSWKICDGGQHHAEMTPSFDPVVDRCGLFAELVSYGLRSIS
jgi:rhamnosyltransferase subunit B